MHTGLLLKVSPGKAADRNLSLSGVKPFVVTRYLKIWVAIDKITSLICKQELDPWSLVEAREQQRRKVSAAAAAVGEIGD